MPETEIRFSFLLFNALLFLMCDIRHITGFYTVCTLHELGHAAAALLTGAGVRRITLSGFGILMDTGRCRSMIGNAAILAAGPAVNLILWAVLTAAGYRGFMTELNLAAGALNLLPFSGLDGGSLSELLISGRMYERGLRLLLAALRILAGAAAAALLVYWLTDRYL